MQQPPSAARALAPPRGHCPNRETRQANADSRFGPRTGHIRPISSGTPLAQSPGVRSHFHEIPPGRTHRARSRLRCRGRRRSVSGGSSKHAVHEPRPGRHAARPHPVVDPSGRRAGWRRHHAGRTRRWRAGRFCSFVDGPRQQLGNGRASPRAGQIRATDPSRAVYASSRGRFGVGGPEPA